MFVNFELAIDTVARRVAIWALRRQRVPERFAKSSYVAVCWYKSTSKICRKHI